MNEGRGEQSAETVLILGGAGMVGIQVAREAAAELRPATIVISALTGREVDEAIELLSREGEAAGWGIRFISAPADIFVPQALQGIDRAAMIADRHLFDQLFEEIFAPEADGYRSSALFQMIEQHKPDVIIDCINTATAISYQDVYTVSRRITSSGGSVSSGLPDRGPTSPRRARRPSRSRPTWSVRSCPATSSGGS